MKTSVGDFVIVSNVGSSLRNKLVKIVEIEEKECIGLLDVPSKEDENKSITFLQKEIIANLGRFPKAGSVFGCKIEPLLKTLKHKHFGEIRVYQKLKDDQLERLLHELNSFYSEIKARGHAKVPYCIEVRNPQGKYAGYYKFLPKAEQDILCIKPDSSLEGLQYILAHEHAHGLYNRRYNARSRNKWIKCYHHYIALGEVSEEDLEQILDEIQSIGSIADYFKDAEADVKPIIKACLKYIFQVHGLSKHHLETALSIQESIADYWPVSAIDFSEKSIALTEYAMKNPEELHSESYAHWFLNRPLPKKIDSLLTDSLSKLTK
jgi:hypothetical protein